jgi:hypothetical protein
VQTGQDVAGAIVLPAEGQGMLFVPEFAAPDAQLMALAGVSDDPVFRSEAKPSFAVYELPDAHQVPELVEAPRFAGDLSLVGYEITTPQQGQAIQLVTAWRVDGELPDDLAIFVHWLDGDGQLISQHDGFDAAPETLQRGDILLQRHLLPWPSTLQTPPEALQIGLYRREDGRRLSVVDGAGNTADHALISLGGDETGG